MRKNRDESKRGGMKRDVKNREIIEREERNRGGMKRGKKKIKR